MPKTTIYCIRHAEGFHNLSEANHSIPDPDLTPKGITQCQTLSTTFPTLASSPKITHLVASPLRRTIYTCLLSFPEEVKRGLKVHALPELQETSDLPCDTGSSPSKLTSEFSTGEYAGCVDLSLVHEGWNSKTGKWSPASSAIEARAKEARIWLRELAEEAHKKGEVNGNGDVEIVVVTHGGYLHYFTEDWVGMGEFVGTGWMNTEFRSYEFEGAGDGLRETETSRRRRGKGQELSRDEQRELRASAERENEEKGFIGGNAKL